VAHGAAVIGIDVGGTFIDYVVLQPGRPARVHKALNQPTALAAALLDGLREIAPDRIGEIVHGTTTATNAIIERKGARVALVTTAGFADVIEIGRQDRPNLYGLESGRPAPLVERDLRFEAVERVSAAGEVIVPLRHEDVASVVDSVRRAAPSSVAVCLLFSFLAPDHERAIATALEAEGFFVTSSVQVMPEHREYERTSTTVANAYVSPLLGDYLGEVSTALETEYFVDRFEVMQSNGGVLRAREAATQGARLLLSGPAGGVAGAFELARGHGIDRIITFDMGGTSTDVALCDGAIPMTTERDVAGVPIRLPMVDVETIGAGGGSIARVDSGGALRVGPESAGANPGPACFGTGTLPTVTDAQAVCGLLDVESFLGGRLGVDIGRAVAVIGQLATSLRTDAHGAALGVLRLANVAVEHAIRRISIERGFDPREFTLVAFGGAGPLHACPVADGLGISRLIIPPFPGVMSALGMARAEATRDFSLSALGSDHRLDDIWLSLDTQAREALPDGSILRSVDCRYRGQGYEIEIPYEPATGLEDRFHAAHLRRFGFEDRARPIELVTARVTARQSRDVPSPEAPPSQDGKAIARETTIWWNERPQVAQVIARDEVQPGTELMGPALVVQADSATFVAPGWCATRRPDGSLFLERGA
jgi:N-methylhydantoinase A